METALKPYPEYREAGLRWLDRIPAHWEVQRAKTVFQPVDVRSKTGQEELLSVSSSDGVRRRSEKKVTMFQAASYVGHKLCWPGDLVINSLWAWAKGLGISKYHGIISTAYGVYRPRRRYAAFTDYFHPLLRSEAYGWEFKVRSKGIWISRLQLTDTSFLDMPVLLPPAEEARQMGRFIKDYDRRVNRLIRTKQRLIALLDEQKQTIVHRAVTRGLDPNVPLKPSGVDWLGDVPEHWEVSRIKGQFENLNRYRIPLSTVERGRMKSREYDYYGASGVIDQVDDYLFDDELILIAEDGANLVLRNLPLVIIARGKFWVNNHAHILKPRRGNLQYWAYLLESLSYRPWITGAAQPKLTQDRLMAVPIPAPPDEEQDEIVAHVRDSTKQLDEAVQRSRSEIDLIREYRIRLIADVVTGQLDVRGLAIPEMEGDDTAVDHEITTDEESLLEEDALAYADD